MRWPRVAVLVLCIPVGFALGKVVQGSVRSVDGVALEAAQDTVLSDRQLRQRFGWLLSRIDAAMADLGSTRMHAQISWDAIHARIVRDSLAGLPPVVPPPPVPGGPDPTTPDSLTLYPDSSSVDEGGQVVLWALGWFDHPDLGPISTVCRELVDGRIGWQRVTIEADGAVRAGLSFLEAPCDVTWAEDNPDLVTMQPDSVLPLLPPDTVPVTVQVGDLTLRVGETSVFPMQFLNAGGDVVPAPPSSSLLFDPRAHRNDVVTVADDGTITAVRAGTTQIHVSVRQTGVFGSGTVTVTDSDDAQRRAQ